MLAVAEPVAVPAPERSGVVHANGVNALDLEAGALAPVDDEAKRGARVSAGEDVLVHEETPDEILVLPRLAETGHLQVEDAVVVHHVIDLGQESAEVAHADVLRHLETGDLLVAAGNAGSIAVVRAEDTALRFVDTGLAETIVAPGSLVATESDTRHLGAVVDRCVLGQRTPAAPKIKDGIAGLDADLLANHSQFVILEFFECLFPVDVADQTRGVNHTRAQEPGVEVVTAVVVVPNLLLI